MKEIAHEYWTQGHAIVTFKISNEKKKPLVEWKCWIEGEQTEEQFNNQPWDRANGFGLICDRKLKNGLFFGVIDFDVKNVSEDAITKGKEVLEKCLVTQREQTYNQGEHFIFYSHEQVKSDKAFHDSHALELFGKGSIVIMAPSEGYTRINDNMPTEKDDLSAYFYELLGKEKPENVWFEREDLKGKRYKGRNPPCINSLFRGTKEGSRNEHGVRLTSYLLNFRKYQPNSVLKIMKKWNKLNTPGLSTTELEHIVKSAIHGNYVYGCSDPILQELCNKEECPISKKVVILTQEDREKGEKLLESPNLLQIVLECGRKRLIGEDSALLQNFIEICSGQTLYPISGIISGFSGSGKNECLRAIKPLIPEEWLFEFTTSTPEAVKYIPEDFCGTLIIYEAIGMRSKTGTLGLRAVGEGESIETIYPMRDEDTGKMTLGRAKTNAKNFITTESGIDIQPDLYRRVLKQSMSHSFVLTKRVMAMQMREAALPESLRQMLQKDGEKKYSTEEFQNALRVQDWKVEVIVFTPSSLLKLLDFAATKEQQVALRTQLKKILWFISVLTLLHQKHRVRIKIEGKKYVIANPQDYEVGLRVLEPTIIETISRIGKRQQEVLELFEKIGILDKHKVAEELNVSTRTAARALKTLGEHGYLSENQSVKPYSYQILREKAKGFAILKDVNEYERFYRKELGNFLKHTLPPYYKSGIPKKIEIEGLNERWEQNPLEKIGVAQSCPVGKVLSEQEPTFSHEKKHEPFAFGKMARENTVKETEKGVTPHVVLVENELSQQRGMKACPLCASKGQQVTFLTQQDLDIHIQKIHGLPEVE